MTTAAARKYAAEQGIAEKEALEKGMEAKSKEFVERERRSSKSLKILLAWLRETWDRSNRRIHFGFWHKVSEPKKWS